ncbi:MAG: hypothetical protein MR937_07650, partial [Spirochaetia bacterium]|nr:hypothetical protein [Spirochaetia bacterium]
VERTGKDSSERNANPVCPNFFFLTLKSSKIYKKNQDLKRNERRRIGGRGDRRSPEANEGGVERTGKDSSERNANPVCPKNFIPYFKII